MYPGVQEQNQQIGVLMKAFIDQTVEFYNHLDAQPVIRSPKNVLPDGLSDTLTVPTQGRPLQEVYTEMLQKVYAHTLLAQHPRSFSCIPSTASLLSWMGDVMTNAYNPHASCRRFRRSVKNMGCGCMLTGPLALRRYCPKNNEKGFPASSFRTV